MRRLLLFAVALLLVPGPAAAQISLHEGGDIRLGLSGYVRTFTGIHDRGFDLPERFPGFTPAGRTSGFHSQVGRAKWQLEGGSWRFDLHNRLQVRVPGDEQGPGVGFGVTAVPARLVDLETDLVETPDVRAWHDIDRLSLSLFTDAADVTIGRQAITWGVSSIFPVADLWARFSPFEMDTEEKPGIDAVRALFYPVEGLEMDAVVADRGSLDDLSVGLRGTYAHSTADLWAGVGKFWREAMLMGGASLMLDEARVRGEVVLPWELDGGGMQDPRVTVGYDWIRSDLALTAEYHFNGIGAASTDGYTATAQDPRYTRGETYYLGRHYLGGLVSWSPDEENRASLALNALVNVQDASAALTPMIGYDLGQSTRISLGGLLSLGDTPTFTAFEPTLRSEFGAYGSMLFTRVSVYF